MKLQSQTGSRLPRTGTDHRTSSSGPGDYRGFSGPGEGQIIGERIQEGEDRQGDRYYLGTIGLETPLEGIQLS